MLRVESCVLSCRVFVAKILIPPQFNAFTFAQARLVSMDVVMFYFTSFSIYLIDESNETKLSSLSPDSDHIVPI